MCLILNGIFLRIGINSVYGKFAFNLAVQFEVKSRLYETSDFEQF